MIKNAFTYLGELLQTMKLFEKIFPIAELINTDQGLHPVQYVGEGKYTPINFSAYAGCAYLRKTAPIQFAKSATESLIGCEINHDATIEIKLVASVRKDLLKCDEAFAAVFLGEEIFRKLNGRSSAMTTFIGIKDAEIIVRNIETDIIKILNEERAGATDIEINYEWIIVSCDVEVKLMYDQSCMNAFCDGYEGEMQLNCPDVVPCPECPDVPSTVDRAYASMEYNMTNLDGSCARPFPSPDGEGWTGTEYKLISVIENLDLTKIGTIMTFTGGQLTMIFSLDNSGGADIPDGYQLIFKSVFVEDIPSSVSFSKWDNSLSCDALFEDGGIQGNYFITLSKKAIADDEADVNNATMLTFDKGKNKWIVTWVNGQYYSA